MKSEVFWSWATGLSLFGILLAIYLLWQQAFRPAFQPCNITSVVNCNAIISGSVSQTFGISTPLIGFTGYIIMLIASFFHKKKLLFAMASFGFIFCAWIAYQEIIFLKVICPVCILCQLTMLSVFILSILILQRKESR